jgi:hypothetical protein
MSEHGHGALPSCREIVDGLPAWSEGSLAGEAREQFERHFEVCPPCGAFARTYRAVAAVAKAALAVDMPEDARARLRARIAAKLGRSS